MQTNKGHRWWLPGPPPPRRLKSLEAVESSYRKDGVPEMAIPVRHISVPWVDRLPVLQPYFRHLGGPGATTGRPHDGDAYLFHGCGNVSSLQVVHSFARRGPSIRFSRNRSYFSNGRAVYWSNSVEFAIAWSFFSETGSWNMEDFERKRSFRCLVFVSKLNLAKANFKAGLYLIPTPQLPEDEEELGKWCHANMNSQTEQIPPPKSKKKDWGVIGSRIPRHTMEALQIAYEKPEDIWLFAARDEADSETISKAGIEILDLTFYPSMQSASRL